jgi:hypothetical protein
MNKKVRKAIEAKAEGRSYHLLRHVGNRVEVHFMGDYESTEIQVGPNDLTEAALNLSRKDAVIKKAKELGIPTSGKTKAQLIEAIIEHG